MATTRGSFPHPVLGGSDDVTSDVKVVNATIGPTHEDIEVTYTVETNDPDLWALIDGGDARHSLRWTCSATISTDEVVPDVVRRRPDSVTLRTWIDQQLVRGEISADIRVVAARPVDGFSWKNQHEDYGDATFDLQTGDTLVEAGTIVFDAKKLYDPLSPPVGSCFEFVAAPGQRKGISLNFDYDDVVKVQLPPAVHEGLAHMSARPDLQIGMVVLPALMGTLDFLRRVLDDPDAEDLSDRRWYTAIMDLVEDAGGIDESSLVLAQRILEHPLDRALLAGIPEDEEDE